MDRTVELQELWRFGGPDSKTLLGTITEGDVDREGNVVGWNRAAEQMFDDTRYVCVRREDDEELIAALEEAGFEQDGDVLDTWFSSALWPFSTLGWPEDTGELETWNPSNVLVTARDIITLWVSRMVMTNLYLRNCLPFTDVYINAMVQDGQGRRMSKSLGNGVDPLDIIERYGADAMRLFSLFAAPPVKGMEWTDEGIEGQARFIRRVFRLYERFAGLEGAPASESVGEALELRRKTHETIGRDAPKTVISTVRDVHPPVAVARHCRRPEPTRPAAFTR